MSFIVELMEVKGSTTFTAVQTDNITERLCCRCRTEVPVNEESSGADVSIHMDDVQPEVPQVKLFATSYTLRSVTEFIRTQSNQGPFVVQNLPSTHPDLDTVDCALVTSTSADAGAKSVEEPEESLPAPSHPDLDTMDSALVASTSADAGAKSVEEPDESLPESIQTQHGQEFSDQRSIPSQHPEIGSAVEIVATLVEEGAAESTVGSIQTDPQQNSQVRGSDLAESSLASASAGSGLTTVENTATWTPESIPTRDERASFAQQISQHPMSELGMLPLEVSATADVQDTLSEKTGESAPVPAVRSDACGAANVALENLDSQNGTAAQSDVSMSEAEGSL